MANFSGLAGNFVDVINMIGEPVVISRVTRDPTNWKSPETTKNFNVIAAFGVYKSGDIDGVSILRSDIKITIATSDYKPMAGDTLVYNGKNYNIVNVSTSKISGFTLVYDLQGRL